MLLKPRKPYIRNGPVMLAVLRHVKRHPGCTMSEAAYAAAAEASQGSAMGLRANGMKAVRHCAARDFINADYPRPDGAPGFACTLTELGAEELDHHEVSVWS